MEDTKYHSAGTLRKLISATKRKDGRQHKISLHELYQVKDRLRQRRGAVELKSDGGKRNGDYTIVDGAWVLWADTLTKKELSDIKSVFARYDKGLAKERSKIGIISVKEVGVVMKHLGHDPSPEDIDNIVGETDPASTGYIEYPAFVQAMAKRRKNSADEMRMAFEAFDESGDGLISAEELQSFISSAGENGLTQDEFTEILNEIDIDGDGFIDYEEFVQVFKD